ncbi:amidase [Zhihengliuella halotolerans]|uniref:Amidase n=1 Tax=Zhihengliuella halotolerans TaxID=370736 RepID=A0A4Q8AFU7_9MICC|nr:amidase [Zhihengliuella halotolerans]RZU63227.1 amidase [Zhihengliuella halotolerans]
MHIEEYTVRQLRETVLSGELSAREAAAAHLDRIADSNAELGAFVKVTADLAMTTAARLDRSWASAPAAARRARLGALHGVPVAWKDLWDVAGVATMRGTAAFEPVVAEANSAVVDQIHAHGAVSLGKTQVPEFGLACYSENLISPPSRNPLDPTLTSGGSSGGSAAAVTAGMLPGAIGSDAGGSIRIPASACGLVGLKPGYGVVPADLRAARALDPDAEKRAGAFYVTRTNAPRMAVSGPIARDAADAGALFDALMGSSRPSGAGRFEEAALSHDPGRFAPVLRAQDDRNDPGPRTGRPLRVGVSTASPFESAYPISLSPESREALDAAVTALETAGHEVEEARMAYDPRYPDSFYTTWTSGLTDIPLGAGAEARLGVLARDFRTAALARDEATTRSAANILLGIARDFRTQWGAYDVVLTPAMASTPPPVGYFTGDAGAPHDGDTDYRLQCQYTPFTSMVNVSQLPAIAVPTLTTVAGLSMGVQFIGRAGSEAQLLALAAQLEPHFDASPFSPPIGVA